MVDFALSFNSTHFISSIKLNVPGLILCPVLLVNLVALRGGGLYATGHLQFVQGDFG